jgi:hypothetical protein
VALPEDSKQVIDAFRLGWYVAEVRGRNRPGGPAHADTMLPKGDRHPLPLRIERTPAERRIEAQGMLAALAQQLGVDSGTDGGYGTLVDQNAHRLAKARSEQVPADAAWEALAAVLWKFDAHIQDVLPATSEMRSCAYQLGRGLAETYWALVPTDTQGPQSYRFLFGQPRCAELSRLIGRLSAYLNTYTGSAMVGSIEIWKDFAHRDTMSADESAQACEALRNQIRRWYELVVLAQDPTTLIRPFDVIGSYRTLAQAIKQFAPQVVATVIGLGALVVVLIMLSVGEHSDLVQTIGVVLAAAGVSIGGVTGALKNSAQSILVRLRQDTYTELVTEGITVQPPAMTKREMRTAMARRKLTPITES